MKTDNAQIISGGFHVAWLIPIEGIFTFSVLTLSSKFGLGVAFLIALPIFGYVLKKISDNEPKISYDFESWSEALDLAVQNDQVVPSLESFKAIEYKQKKTSVPKLSFASSKSKIEKIKTPAKIRTKKPAFY